MWDEEGIVMGFQWFIIGLNFYYKPANLASMEDLSRMSWMSWFSKKTMGCNGNGRPVGNHVSMEMEDEIRTRSGHLMV